MAQPTWITPAGSIGTYTEEFPLSYTIAATPSTVGHTLVYTLLNGDFPVPEDSTTTFTLNQTTGQITGTPGQVPYETTSTFTIRVNEYNGSTFVSFNDRTFSITIVGQSMPNFTTTPGALYVPYLLDSTWNPFQVLIDNPDPDTVAVIRLIDGSLPPGLSINEQGWIIGYATPPVNQSNNPITSSPYVFTLEVSNGVSSSTATYSITVQNQELMPGYTKRPPVIMNTQPPSYNITISDPNFPYYVGESADLGTYCQNNYFLFKVLGVDFNGLPLTYTCTGLPPGLSYNSVTGWITGTITTLPSLVNTYSIYVSASNGFTTSTTIGFSMTVVKDTSNVPIDTSVTWLTYPDLGIILNGSISTMAVQAVAASGVELEYALLSGPLPSNLQLLSTGEIAGKVAFEVDASLIPAGTNTSYTITIQAYNATYPEISSIRDFTFTLYQAFDTPYENLYIKALLSYDDREKISSLLTDVSIIPNEYLYRPDDIYFGKASSVIYQHMYGVPSSSVDDYIAAIIHNHYWRNITLGPIKTAIAKDDTNTVIYEVVYSEIIDNLINNTGKSISKEFVWPVRIDNMAVTVYPNSLPNMRTQVADVLGQNSNSSILPLWMTSQQENGSSLGFTPAWVICYTQPGYSATIKENIETMWQYKLNEINFQLDRFEVDKSLTFDYVPPWSTLPSGVVTDNSQDQYIYFPQKNILY